MYDMYQVCSPCPELKMVNRFYFLLVLPSLRFH